MLYDNGYGVWVSQNTYNGYGVWVSKNTQNTSQNTKYPI